MKKFSEKIYLTLTPSTEEFPESLQQKFHNALENLGYSSVKFPLKIVQKLYSLCQQTDYRITITLVRQENGWTITDAEPGDTRNRHYGLAVDYGSTTIIMQLVDLNSGEILAQAQETNGQVRFGTDILTRITYIMEDDRHMEDMQKATIETFHTLLEKLTLETGIDARNTSAMIISGNTTMIHFLLKLDARTVFFAPYAPVTMNPGWFWGSELEMDFSGIVYIIPAASNYVGGDIVSGLLNLDFYHQDKISMFFDIGTNGELVMGNKDFLLAGAGAAGPALEGYISKFGMRAQPGAIYKIKIDGQNLSYTTIADQPPIGICGSGIIDLLAQMRIHGWINIAGQLEPETSSRIVFHPEEEEYVVIYATKEEAGNQEDLYFSQTDIKQYLDTKAAAFTMIDCLLETACCSEQDLANIYLSGAFTAHSDLEAAITIGIFPDIPRDRYALIKNSSLDGARTLLLDQTKLEEIKYLTSSMYCVQFASIPDFLIRMQAAKFIPHTDMYRFPIVEANLSR